MTHGTICYLFSTIAQTCAALAAFVPLVDVRPLRARVASHNAGSIRVLEKCGFVATGVSEVARSRQSTPTELPAGSTKS